MKEVLSAETKRKLAELAALEEGGVDNWEGYGDSLQPLGGVEFQDDPEPKSSWQPIETAPRDGKIIIGFAVVYPESGIWQQYLMSWGQNYVGVEEWCGWPRWSSPQPTHWMPLPPPPEETK